MRRLGREDGLRSWEGWRLAMENELGHILPILPSDLTILLSSLMSLTIKTSYGISRYNHFSSSRFCKHMYAAQWMQWVLQCVLCWPGDWIWGFSLMSVVERGFPAQSHWTVSVWGCCQMPSDHVCHYARLGRTKNAVNISICHLPGAPAVALISLSSFLSW